MKLWKMIRSFGLFRFISLLLVVSMFTGLVLAGCGSASEEEETGAASDEAVKAGENGIVKVYNWGEYIDEETIDMFEEETGIKVIYDLFETNEEMYPVIAAGGVSYDVICPSDYMIEKLMANGLLAEINWDNIPNAKYLEDNIMELTEQFDPGNKYAVPYTYGTLGILYNETMVKEGDVIDSWDDMWNEDYDKDILMYNSVRDLFVAPLRRMGLSINTTDEARLREALQMLIDQKSIVQGYYMDQVKELMVSGAAAMAMVYSGEVLALQEINDDLKYVVPKEGSNFFVDAWVIPANAENKENAEAWINFMNRTDIALKNFEYVTYCIPHSEAKKEIDQEILDAIFPDEEVLSYCEVFDYLGEDGDEMFNRLWLELKGTDVK